ncbi:MAG TPA: tRNA pseudouridine(38-40) synthase TruA [Actinomycetales bacterium]|nr:tRNA pseudouridine(38-40) synthase TruA [Actinomycetales bacterium]
MAYDGTDFSGWATQPGLRTVEGELTQALGKVLRLQPPPRLTVAGRTDAGVHARGQVAHVDLPTTTWAALTARADVSPSGVLVRRLGAVLPADVVVSRVAPAPEGFDARFSATSRRYAYRIADEPALRDPLRRHDVIWHRRPLDVVAMHDAAQRLLGEHDWLPFCRPREGASTVRRLMRLDWERDAAGLAVAHVVADAFCHHMVRALVGASVAVGEGRRPVEWPADVLAAGVRDTAVAVMPAQGLTLEEVTYPDDGSLAAQARVARRVRGPVNEALGGS